MKKYENIPVALTIIAILVVAMVCGSIVYFCAKTSKNIDLNYDEYTIYDVLVNQREYAKWVDTPETVRVESIYYNNGANREITLLFRLKSKDDNGIITRCDFVLAQFGTIQALARTYETPWDSYRQATDEEINVDKINEALDRYWKNIGA